MGVRFSHPQPNRSRKAAVFSGHSAAGSAPGSGLGGRGFKSRCSDQETDAERHPSFFVPPGAYPANATDPTESTISTVSRYPPKPTKPTISTKSRFHGTHRKARKQRFQRNHDSTVPYENHESNDFNDFTVPYENHEINGFNESNEMPEKEAFRCFRCVCINRDFVGNVAGCGYAPYDAAPGGCPLRHSPLARPVPPPPQGEARARPWVSARRW